MAIKQLNTRIVLRNDALSAWEASQKALLQGEMALARLSGELSDKFEVRIGTGDKTWNQLSSSNFIIPAANVIGLENELTSLKESFYEVGTYAELPIDANVTQGSIGIVKEVVAIAETAPEYAALSSEGKQLSTEFRTAYYFDTQLTSETNPNGTWRQMDGNYKAENVYFTDNLKLTEQFGKHKAVATGYTLSCKNMSLDAVLKEAYAETKTPSVTQPGFTFTTTAALTGEVGTNYTVPAATFKMTSTGSYGYGPAATGVKVLSGAVISAESKAGIAEKTLSSELTANNASFASTSGVTSAFVDSTVTYNYKATYTYTDGVIPQNNIGGQAPAQQIKGKTDETLSCKCEATGYLPAFYVVTTAVKAVTTAIDSSTSKDENGLAYTKVLNNYSKTTFTDPDGWYQIFYVTPKSKNTKTSWSGTDSSSGLPVNPVPCTDCTVTLLNGETADYRVFIVQNSAKGDAGTATMVYA